MVNTSNVILGIIKTYCNIVKTRPSNVNYGNINAIALGSNYAPLISAKPNLSHFYF